MGIAARKRPVVAPRLLAIAIAGAFLVAFFATLGHYGLTWDEPENFHTGERYVRFFTSLDWKWVSFEHEELAAAPLDDQTRSEFIRQLDAFRRESARDFESARAHERFAKRDLGIAFGYPPVANIASALTDEVLSHRLGLLGPREAHHAAIGLFWAALLVAVFAFTRRVGGAVAAAAATGTLAAAPRLFGPVHNNVKDLPETAMFGLALVALHKAVADDRPGFALLAGGVAGLTVGTKLNGAFVFVVAGAWLLLRRRDVAALGPRTRAALLASPVVAAGVFFLTWPYLWADPFHGVLRFVRYGIDIATGAKPVPPGYALLYAAVTAPPVVLAAAAVGLATIRRLGRAGSLIALWLLVPLLRSIVPGVAFYDGIRQYMEYWPALAIFAGLGAAAVARRVRPRAVAALAVVAVLLVPQVFADVRLHPYEDVYFSRVVGGPAGARAAGLRWTTDYWGNSYLEAARWANAHLPRGAALYAPIAGFLLAYDGLRPDIRVWGPLDPRPPGTDQYVVYITRTEFYGDIERKYDRRPPLFEIRRSGLPLLKLHELDA